MVVSPLNLQSIDNKNECVRFPFLKFFSSFQFEIVGERERERGRERERVDTQTVSF